MLAELLKGSCKVQDLGSEARQKDSANTEEARLLRDAL